MEEIQNEVRLEFGDTESVLDEFKRRIDQAVEKDRDKLKKLAEQESVGIITRAREEADNIVAEANRQAKEETERIVAKAQKEADEIRQKAESDVAQVLAEATKKAREIVTKTEEKICPVLAESGRIVMEAHQKLEKAIAAVEQEFKEPERQDEAISVPTSLRGESEHAVPRSIGPGSGVPTTWKDDERDYEGRLELRIVPPVDGAQASNFKEQLLQIPYLRLLTMSGSSDGGTLIIAELPKPLPILKEIRQIPAVREAVWYKDDIYVALKSKRHI